eukprot:TRINITY_DN24829_c0_g3_i2.p1 TRINITY_DN24829_c0_g3~~TRINITY_DN24829_c0_g3_i2.p1  ORF type:complete len:612 (-),score=117.80 TRINITY_DN24829_c0_g3_i2:124-1893(-)
MPESTERSERKPLLADDESQNKVVNEARPGNEESHQANIDKIGAGPPIDTSPIDSYWLVITAFLFLPVHLVIGVINGLCRMGSVMINNVCMRTWLLSGPIGCCCTRQPAWSYWLWIWGAIGTLVVLGRERGRLGLFQTYLAWYGDGEGQSHWWAMSSLWTWKFKDCYRIVKNFQERGPYFGGNKAARPKLWPVGSNEAGGGNFLLWVSGPKHTSLRRAFHNLIIGQFELTKKRFQALPDYLRPYLPYTPQTPAEFLAMLQDTKDGDVGVKLVSRSAWLLVFGIKLTDEEFEWAKEWGSAAAYFILPQFVQNLALGTLERKVVTMRRRMVTIMCRRPGVVKLFTQLNDLLDTTKQGGADYSNPDVEATMDEFQFVVNFAGLLGTLQLLQSTLYALNRKPNPEYVREDQIIFPETLVKDGKNLSYIDAYNLDPIAFLKEVARLDPPVTSANALTRSPTEFRPPTACGCNGPKLDVPAGNGNQYALSLGNRDKSNFPNPLEFNPFRRNINDVLSWNGVFPFPEEEGNSSIYDPMARPTYDPNGDIKAPLPLSKEQKNNFNRICPGRNIALQVVTMILGLCPALNETPLSIKS